MGAWSTLRIRGWKALSEKRSAHDNLVRLSVGLGDLRDLVEDLGQALDAIGA